MTIKGVMPSVVFCAWLTSVLAHAHLATSHRNSDQQPLLLLGETAGSASQVETVPTDGVLTLAIQSYDLMGGFTTPLYTTELTGCSATDLCAATDLVRLEQQGRLAASVMAGGNGTIIVFDEGDVVRLPPLVTGWLIPTLSVSPRGEMIAFTDATDPYNTDVRVVRIGHQEATSVPLFSAHVRRISPEWDPMGEWLSYTVVPALLSGETAVYRTRLSDGVTEVFLENALNAIWSPDGREVASCQPTAKRDAVTIVIADRSGVYLATLATELIACYLVRWSPDGLWLAYTTETGIVVVPRTGGNDLQK